MLEPQGVLVLLDHLALLVALEHPVCQELQVCLEQEVIQDLLVVQAGQVQVDSLDLQGHLVPVETLVQLVLLDQPDLEAILEHLELQDHLGH